MPDGFSEVLGKRALLRFFVGAARHSKYQMQDSFFVQLTLSAVKLFLKMSETRFCSKINTETFWPKYNKISLYACRESHQIDSAFQKSCKKLNRDQISSEVSKETSNRKSDKDSSKSKEKFRRNIR